MTNLPKITFGVIVLNGEPFTKYCLRQIYPFAHQIIVVEGASVHAKAIATEDGHSTDRTLEALREFQRDEDPEHKLEIVTKDGFWSEKDEMSRAYAVRATGDYLWQVDIDEFYRQTDLERVCEMLKTDPSITAVSFHQLCFWGSPDVVCDSVRLRTYDPRRPWNPSEFHRLFKWGPDYRYASHRPPTVLTPAGTDLRAVHWIDANEMAAQGILLYHYSLLFPKQVREKCLYYQNMPWEVSKTIMEWAEKGYFLLETPFHVHPSGGLDWLNRYGGPHPEQVPRLWEDIEKGRFPIDRQNMKRAESLLQRRGYRWTARALMFYADRVLPILRKLRSLIPKTGIVARIRSRKQK